MSVEVMKNGYNVIHVNGLQHMTDTDRQTLLSLLQNEREQKKVQRMRMKDKVMSASGIGCHYGALTLPDCGEGRVTATRKICTAVRSLNSSQ
jgi:hypothetical protein